MTYSVSNKYIFIHTPKCAGTSMNIMLKKYYDGITTYDHCGKEYLDYFFDKKVWNSFFKFAFVRNPWDKMVSWYEHLIRYKRINREKTSFNSFLKNYKLDKRIDRKRNIYYQENQYDFLTNKKGILDLQYIGKFETLEKDWKMILKILELPYKPLIHKNKNVKNKKYRDYYDDWSYNYILEVFDKDIKYFKYKF